ncbi:hypothetical protein [Zhihengliuella salsuginis]|nr:hypothetical protein [Zhihengliuella salsuginis]
MGDDNGQIKEGCVGSTLDVCDEDEVLMDTGGSMDIDVPSGTPRDVVVADDPCTEINVERAQITATPAPEDVDPADRPDLVAQEFARVDIPQPALVFQDEVEDQVSAGKLWGVAMRGEHMNMWVESPDHTTSVTLLGTEITIRATPLQYTWDYGNGQTRTTAQTGGPLRAGSDEGSVYSETATSQAYEETGFYPVTVTTVYAGQFKTPTSEWIPIPGVATVTSPAKTATVWKSETRLVSGDCSENPGSWGCETVPFPWEGGPQTSEAFKAAQEELEARQ